MATATEPPTTYALPQEFLDFQETIRKIVVERVAPRAAQIDADAEYPRDLRELFAEHKSITTFGPYSPGQAVTMKRMGIEGIYLGGWATSAKGSTSEDPGPDLARYPLSQVPDAAAGMTTSPPSRRMLSSESGPNGAISMSRSDPRSSPVISHSIHTSSSRTTINSIRTRRRCRRMPAERVRPRPSPPSPER